MAIADHVKGATKKLKDFNEMLDADAGVKSRCQQLKSKVTEFASKFPMPGFDDH